MPTDFLSKLREVGVSGILDVGRLLGIRGLLKSLYYSLRYTGRPVALLVGKRASVDSHADATVDIDSTFRVGVTHSRTIHPVLAGTRLDIDAGASFRTSGDPWVGPGTVLNIRGTFEMGDSFINGLTRVHCFDSISIGDGCAISWNVDILDSNSHQLFADGEWRPAESPVVIGDDVWIGQGATILPGVEIGDGAVVAADSVVTSDVPPAALVAGSPARVLRSDVRWR